ncbi:MAG TPA: hypothetical protein VGE45_00985 [Chloroflexia bacterium]|jgi:hypothetical protein
MGTHAAIGVLNEDGTVQAIYVHNDGDPPWTGKRLHLKYRSLTQIQKLLGLGNLSQLGNEIGEKHSFDERMNWSRNIWEGGRIVGRRSDPYWYNWCLSYHRDRAEPWEDWTDDSGQGWPGQKPTEFKSERDYVNRAEFELNAHWLYLYKSGQWLVTDHFGPRKRIKWTPMEELMPGILEEEARLEAARSARIKQEVAA